MTLREIAVRSALDGIIKALAAEGVTHGRLAEARRRGMTVLTRWHG